MSDEEFIEDCIDRWEIDYERGVDHPPELLAANRPSLAHLVGSAIARRKAQLDARCRIAGRSEESRPVPEEAFDGLPFRPVSYFAEGGMGVVYTADDTQLVRRVAVKQIKPGVPVSPEVEGRFLREALLTAQLAHPGVAPVYGLGRDRHGRLYYAMRLLGGRKYGDVIAAFHSDPRPWDSDTARKLQFRELVGQFLAACRVIEYAHSRRVLHRDLKPANIQIGRFGETVILDWGLAKVLGSEQETAPETVAEILESPIAMPPDSSHETQAGNTLGSPAYMAPEQARPELGLPDERTDVFCLGATLYHLLYGHPPYQDLDQARSGQDTSGRTNRKVSQPLEAVCRKAMSFASEDRYPSVTALAEDINRWLADEPVTAWREPFRIRLGRWINRHRTAVVGGAVAAMVAIIALVIGLVLVENERQNTVAAEGEANKQKTLAQTAQQKAEEAQKRAEKGERTAEAERYLATMKFGDLALQDGRLDVLKTQLLSDPPRVNGPHGFEWYYLRREVENLNTVRLSNEGVRSEAIRFSPDGVHLAIGESFGQEALIRIWNIPQRKIVHKLKGHQGAVRRLAYSPDGQTLVSGGDDGFLRLWDTTTGNHRSIRGGLFISSPIHDLALSPDGKTIAVVRDAPLPGSKNILEWWDRESGQRRATKQIQIGPKNLPYRIAILADGESVLVSKPAFILRAHPREPDIVPVSLLESQVGFALASHPTTGRIVAGGMRGELMFFDGTGTRDGKAYSVGTGEIRDLCFTGDGSHLAVCTQEGQVTLWDTTSRMPVERFVGLGVPGHGVAASPDGRTVAASSLSGPILVWNREEEVSEDSRRTGLSTIGALAFAGNDKVLLGGGDGYPLDGTPTLAVMKTSNLQLPVQALQGPEYRIIHHPALTPDGSTAIVAILSTSSATGRIDVWDVETGKKSRTIPLTGGAYTGVLAPDGNIFAVIVSDGLPYEPDGPAFVELYDTKTWERKQRKRITNPQANQIAFSPDGKRLAIASYDSTRPVKGGSIDIADTTNGRIVARWDTEMRLGGITFLNNQTLATGESIDPSQPGPSPIRLWNIADKTEVGKLDKHNFFIASLVHIPTSNRLVSVDQSGLSVVWDLTTKKVVTEYKGTPYITPSVVFGTKMLRPAWFHIANTPKPTTIQLVDILTGTVESEFEEPADYYTYFAFSSDGKRALICNQDGGPPQLWDVSTRKLLHRFGDRPAPPDNSHTSTVLQVTATPDGERFVTSSVDGTVKVWDTKSGRVIRTIEKRSRPVNKLAMSRDGLLIAAAGGNNQNPDQGGDDVVLIWRIDTGEQVAELRHSQPIGALAFDPTGRTLAITISFDPDVIKMRPREESRQLFIREIQLWDVKEHRYHDPIRMKGTTLVSISSLTFSNDGRTLTWVESLGQDRCVVWDLVENRHLFDLVGHQGRINSVAFSPDDKTIATGSQDRTARLWQASTGQLMLTLRKHRGPVHAVAFSPDGRTLASAGEGGTGRKQLTGEVHLWRGVGKGNETRQMTHLDPDTNGGRAVLVTTTTETTVHQQYLNEGRQALGDQLAGIVFQVVPDSQAAVKGLQVGDQVISYRGEMITSPQSGFFKRTVETASGVLLYRRGAEERTIEVKPGPVGVGVQFQYLPLRSKE